MKTSLKKLEEMWSRQKITSLDVDYNCWSQQRQSILELSRISKSCLFTVDVFKGIYDFASDSFAELFDFSPSSIKKIQKEGDLLEEKIHPDDREQLLELQLKHSQFIYSLPQEKRNDFRQTYQYRMLNKKRQYINVISRQNVLQKDRNGKAWIILGMMDIAPDQVFAGEVKCTTLNVRTGEVVIPQTFPLAINPLTTREKEILQLISHGFLSKEIAYKLGISIHTVNNHRKNILAKLDVDNVIEAINIISKLEYLL